MNTEVKKNSTSEIDIQHFITLIFFDSAKIGIHENVHKTKSAEICNREH